MKSGDRSKPDPDEPWRFVCPDCERQVYRAPSTTRYRCHHCDESFRYNDLRDLKLVRDHD